MQSKKELQNIAQENSGDIDFKDFLKTYKDYTSDITVPSGNPMRSRKNFIELSYKLSYIHTRTSKIYIFSLR